MFENIWEEIGESTSEDILLGTVTDEYEKEVHIIRQITTKQDGALLDNCILAVYPDETLYPDYTSKTVQTAMKQLAQTKKEV